MNLPAIQARIADRRVLRLALGTSLALCVSQALGWPLSFIAPLVAMVLLALPMPAPTLKMGIALIAAILGPILIGSVVLLPFFSHLHIVGIILVVLALFHSFYLAARGAPAAVGTFLTIGITLNVAIGSVNIDALYAIVSGLAKGAISGLLFVWLAHECCRTCPRHFRHDVRRRLRNRRRTSPDSGQSGRCSSCCLSPSSSCSARRARPTSWS